MLSQSRMRMKAALPTITALVCFVIFCVAGRASQQAAKTDAATSQGIVRADDLKWAPFLGVAQVAPVSGDRSQPGPFVLRVKIPAGITIPPHWHPVDENLTVMEGKLAVGMGDVFDANKLTVMERGDFVQMRAKMNHYTHAVTEVVVQVHGIGPFAITFVNPADDPRLKK
jgi:quercetin dioxygenase-like cupin family protein